MFSIFKSTRKTNAPCLTMANGLTKRQNQVLDFIRKYLEENFTPPTVREICEKFNFKSTNTVHSILTSLEKKGYINRLKGKSRGIFLKETQMKKDNAELKEIPIISNFDVKNPFLMFSNLSGTIKLDARLFGNEVYFAVRVPDDGLRKDGILKGDLAIIKKQEQPTDGKIIFAVVGNEGLLRYYKFENGMIHLVPSSKSYDTLRLKPDDENLWIGGELAFIIRKVQG